MSPREHDNDVSRGSIRGRGPGAGGNRGGDYSHIPGSSNAAASARLPYNRPRHFNGANSTSASLAERGTRTRSRTEKSVDFNLTNTTDVKDKGAAKPADNSSGGAKVKESAVMTSDVSEPDETNEEAGASAGVATEKPAPKAEASTTDAVDGEKE